MQEPLAHWHTTNQPKHNTTNSCEVASVWFDSCKQHTLHSFNSIILCRHVAFQYITSNGLHFIASNQLVNEFVSGVIGGVINLCKSVKDHKTERTICGLITLLFECIGVRSGRDFHLCTGEVSTQIFNSPQPFNMHIFIHPMHWMVWYWKCLRTFQVFQVWCCSCSLYWSSIGRLLVWRVNNEDGRILRMLNISDPSMMLNCVREWQSSGASYNIIQYI